MTTPEASSQNIDKNVWALVPAAGIGSRMGESKPKQYLILNGKTILQHTIERLLAHKQIAKVVVALHPKDELWPSLGFDDHPRIVTVTGGDERCLSVLKGLAKLLEHGHSHDWVLVHDAARPCVRYSDVQELIRTATYPDGALLATPVTDTLKKSGAKRQHTSAQINSEGVNSNVTTISPVRYHCVKTTVDRHGLWQAQTPQMFPLELLYLSLQHAITSNQLVTDESSAMELMGYQPRLVEGHKDNLKVTVPEDLILANCYLAPTEHGDISNDDES